MTAEEPAINDEGADPSSDIQKQNPDEKTTADIVGKDDPNKAEKLTKAGRDINPDAGGD
ncbi:hypothetical protein [Sphingomonas endolithica]|uniref:hypothetical protein n=1 Tax=Sphingomonas endolithica TaxID=2972485 RepID=UPI0021AF995B|nr:hypothetical protein [Sphingomonas sp. ZFBP2030]